MHLLGESGVLTNAMNAKIKHEDEGAKEKLRLAWSARMSKFMEDVSSGKATYNDVENYFSKEELNTMLGASGEITGIKYIQEQDTFRINFKTEGDIAYTGRIKESGEITQFERGTTENIDQTETISETVGYTTYYADINDDGKVDGIIYADLAVGNTGDGQWTDNWGNYTIPTKTGLKKYYISKKDYTDDFGTKDVISPVSGTTGNERFYIMALDDFTTSESEYTRFCWYDDAYGKLDSSNNVATSADDFGSGRTKIQNMIEAWNNETYGAQNDNGTYLDMWGVVQNEVSKGWFVLSKGEWSAFGGEVAEGLGITKSNYGNYGLGVWYWSASQLNTDRAYLASFINAYISNGNVNNFHSVRLSATF